MGMKQIMVIGDTVNDINIYQGNRLKTDSPAGIGSQVITRGGGAYLLYEFIDNAFKEWKNQLSNENLKFQADIKGIEASGSDSKKKIDSINSKINGNNELTEKLVKFDVAFGFEIPSEELPNLFSGYAVWDLFPKTNDKKEKDKVWRISKALGYGSGNEPLNTLFEKTETNEYSTLVIDDAALGFRFKTAEKSWPAFLRSDQEMKMPDSLEHIVYKMASPVCRGDLWRKLSSNEKTSSILTTIISVDDLRKEEIKISKGMSWEQTALELISELSFNNNLSSLRKSNTLIVTLGSEGALMIRNFNKAGEENIELIYDPSCMEEEWDKKNIQGSMFGYMSAITASVGAMISMGINTEDENNLASTGIKIGLQLMRNLKIKGHGGKEVNFPGFNFNELIPDIRGRFGYESISIKPFLNDHGNTADWMILTGDQEPGNPSQIPLYGLARQVAINGTNILKHYPHRQFNDLLTIERKEIESMTNITGLIRDYKENDKGDKPLSIALFGPPGSGKSFTVKELVSEVIGKDAPFLTFNLSQFNDANELIGSFHQIRDKVLKNIMPVVFWDEFDSQEYKWLQFLLAPMQDGEFQEGQITHPIGKCVFIFAGATSYTYEQFGPKEEDAGFKEFKLKKGPDFKSRLSGYLNILGPNRRQEFVGGNWVDDMSDVCFPIRRAILLRAFWKYFGNEYLEIDNGLLTAFLEIDKYTHGTRSMEKLVLSMRYKNKERLLQSNLPNEKIISLYVDYQNFMYKINRDKHIGILVEELAPMIHEYYRELGKNEGWLKEEMDKSFENIDSLTKESNRAAAKRIAKLLAFVGLKITKEDDEMSPTEDQIKRILEQNIELLAEEEHNGWMKHQLAEGWQFAESRDDDKKHHNCLIPYCKLSEKDKGKDRNSVRSFPAILKKTGLSIVRIQ